MEKGVRSDLLLCSILYKWFLITLNTGYQILDYSFQFNIHFKIHSNQTDFENERKTRNSRYL